MVNCWKEAVATELQLAVPHALEAANDPDGGAELGTIGARSEQADVGSPDEAW